jgi:hypothetical protein
MRGCGGWQAEGKRRGELKRAKATEREFEFTVIETVSYQVRAKGATVEKAAERAGEMFAKGPQRYFDAVEDRSVHCDWPAGTMRRAASGAVWDSRPSSAAGGMERVAEITTSLHPMRGRR